MPRNFTKFFDSFQSLESERPSAAKKAAYEDVASKDRAYLQRETTAAECELPVAYYGKAR